MKYRDDMTDEELRRLMAEATDLDDAYARQRAEKTEGEEENFDPVRAGWAGKDGRQ
jgi:hypothetical protein